MTYVVGCQRLSRFAAPAAFKGARSALVASRHLSSGMRCLNLQNPCKPTLQLPPRCGSLGKSPVALFSSVPQQTLLKILKREHAEEIGNADMPTDLADLQRTLEEKDWKIVYDGAMTKLYRSSSTPVAMKVHVSMHCQDSVDSMQDDYLDESMEEQDEEEMVDLVRFTVNVTKAGKSMVFSCLSEAAQAKIQSVAFTATDADTVQSNGGVEAHEYQGPEFAELAEDLQEAFHGFLEDEAGINEDVAAFISMVADFREQQEYVKFLDDSISFLR